MIDDTTRRRFVALTERLVTPRAVGSLHGRAEMLARLPLSVQRWIVDHAPAQDKIGFVVEPYCFFLAYEIADEEAAAALLPPGYRLLPTGLFAGDTPRPCFILGAFTVHASFFWGVRVEQYLVAENVRTGLLTWVICDYESNTISYDPGEGFSAGSTSRAVVTSTHAGEVVVDVASTVRPNVLTVTADLSRARSRPLDQRLWLEGNLSVDYGGRLAHPDSQPFGLVFDPGEVTSALDVPLDSVEVAANTFGAGIRAAEPFASACFPYAQHFLTSAYPSATPIRDREGLLQSVRTEAARELP